MSETGLYKLDALKESIGLQLDMINILYAPCSFLCRHWKLTCWIASDSSKYWLGATVENDFRPFLRDQTCHYYNTVYLSDYPTSNL